MQKDQGAMQKDEGRVPAASRSPRGHCTCGVLRRAARQITQAYDRALRPAGLKITQFSILASVAEAEGLSITDLAENLVMDRTTLTRNLRPMERAGWVTIAPGANRRSRAVRTAPAGREIYERAFPLWQEAERGLRKSLGRETNAELRRLLEMTLEKTRSTP